MPHTSSSSLSVSVQGTALKSPCGMGVTVPDWCRGGGNHPCGMGVTVHDWCRSGHRGGGSHPCGMDVTVHDGCKTGLGMWAQGWG